MNRRRVDIPPLNTSLIHSTQFPNPFDNGGGDTVSHWNSIPPISPYPQIPTGSSNFIPGGPSQLSPVFSFDSLPPLSPLSSTFGGCSSASVADQDSALPPIPFTMRNDHRRAKSDIPFGLECMINEQLTYPNPLELLNGDVQRERKSEVDSLDEFIANFVTLDNIDENGESDTEGESEIGLGVKRRAAKDIGPSGRHKRSVSMDSCFNGPKLPPSPGSLAAILSPTNSIDGDNKFNATEIQQIMGNDRLTEMAASDPKRVKRILANRKSAARSKEKRTRYISELEQKVHTLEADATTMSAKFTVLQKDNLLLTNKNKELTFHLGAMEKQAQLRDALNDQLRGEVHRLKMATGEFTELNPNMFQQLNINQLDEQI